MQPRDEVGFAEHVPAALVLAPLEAVPVVEHHRVHERAVGLGSGKERVLYQLHDRRAEAGGVHPHIDGERVLVLGQPSLAAQCALHLMHRAHHLHNLLCDGDERRAERETAHLVHAVGRFHHRALGAMPVVIGVPVRRGALPDFGNHNRGMVHFLADIDADMHAGNAR